MLTLRRTTSANPDFLHLVRFLDAFLAEVDGDDHAFYAQFNKTDHLQYVVVAYDQETPVGCGAIRPLAPGILEVKRMYVVPECRGQGIASQVLRALEAWAVELAAETCRLETGKKQVEAVALYQKHGYRVISNYGPYQSVENSVCLEKNLGDHSR